MDEGIMQYVQQIKRLAVCGKHGWFDLGAVTLFRRKYKEFLWMKVEEFLSQPRIFDPTLSVCRKDDNRKSSSSSKNPKHNPDSNSSSSSGNRDSSSSSSSSSSNLTTTEDPDIDPIEDPNTAIQANLAEKMIYWQNRYQTLPDSGPATEEELEKFKLIYEEHCRKTG
jgi:hypothetical protein